MQKNVLNKIWNKEDVLNLVTFLRLILDFASSNEMWASIEILDFIPLSSVDYGGGIIITDWYNEGDENSSVKIMVIFI